MRRWHRLVHFEGSLALRWCRHSHEVRCIALELAALALSLLEARTHEGCLGASGHINNICLVFFNGWLALLNLFESVAHWHAAVSIELLSRTVHAGRERVALCWLLSMRGAAGLKGLISKGSYLVVLFESSVQVD